MLIPRGPEKVRPAQAGRYVAVGLVLATALASAQAPPTPEVTFKVEVNYVEEDVRVVDKDGNFVRGLKQEDFQVLEDGKPQKVQTFGMVDIPNTRPRKPLYLAPDALPIEPDVAVNKQVLDGRLYLIVLDDYHVAPLRSQNVRNLARRFVLEKLGPDDQAAVVVTSGLLRASQDFTQNRRLLVEAIDNFVGQKLPSSAVERNEKMSRQMDANGRPTDDAGDPITIDPSNRFVADDKATERMFQTRQALNSLRSIAEWMSAIQGRRKAIIYVSEGVDYNLFDIFTGSDPSNFNFENFNMVQTETWDTVSAASRSNVQIYPVDPRGLTTMGQEDIEIGGLAAGAYGLGPKQLMQELQTSQQNLRLLAEETGGVAFVGRNNFDAAFDRIVQENSSYYVLGYYSTNDRRDGKLRNITVRVAGYPEAQVTYRKRYAAPRGRGPKNTAAGKPLDPSKSLTAELVNTMASPLPRTGIQLRRHGDREERRRQEQRRRSAHRHARQGSDVHGKERHVHQPFVAVGWRVQQAGKVGVRGAARCRPESAPRVAYARHGAWRAPAAAPVAAARTLSAARGRAGQREGAAGKRAFRSRRARLHQESDRAQQCRARRDRRPLGVLAAETRVRSVQRPAAGPAVGTSRISGQQRD